MPQINPNPNTNNLKDPEFPHVYNKTPANMVGTQSKLNFGRTFTFRFRRHVDDAFSGMWELASIGPNGKVEKILQDANGLNYCLDQLAEEMELEGY